MVARAPYGVDDAGGQASREQARRAQKKEQAETCSLR
jgi:hypothetical protein